MNRNPFGDGGISANIPSPRTYPWHFIPGMEDEPIEDTDLPPFYVLEIREAPSFGWNAAVPVWGRRRQGTLSDLHFWIGERDTGKSLSNESVLYQCTRPPTMQEFSTPTTKWTGGFDPDHRDRTPLTTLDQVVKVLRMVPEGCVPILFLMKPLIVAYGSGPMSPEETVTLTTWDLFEYYFGKKKISGGFVRTEENFPTTSNRPNNGFLPHVELRTIVEFHQWIERTRLEPVLNVLSFDPPN